MSWIDQVLLSDDASRAIAVQGDMNALVKQYTLVNVVQAVNAPLAQSSSQWQHDMQQLAPMQTEPPMQQMQSPPMDQPAMQRQRSISPGSCNRRIGAPTLDPKSASLTPRPIRGTLFPYAAVLALQPFMSHTF